MLQIKNLSKSYGAKKAVSNLSFVVEDGDIMGFIGKNGAGKTTTLKACLGIIGTPQSAQNKNPAKKLELSEVFEALPSY